MSVTRRRFQSSSAIKNLPGNNSFYKSSSRTLPGSSVIHLRKSQSLKRPLILKSNLDKPSPQDSIHSPFPHFHISRGHLLSGRLIEGKIEFTSPLPSIHTSLLRIALSHSSCFSFCAKILVSAKTSTKSFPRCVSFVAFSAPYSSFRCWPHCCFVL